jgi:sarcosine oxidase, subunit beta
VYSITDDWYPIVGRSEWLDGMYEAVGGSGHCFKLGPPIGEALAALIAGDTPTVDISALDGSRFRTRQTFQSVWGAGNRA